MKLSKKGSGDARRGRQYSRAVANRPISDLLAALSELEATTRPQDGAASARSKDKKAVAALNLTTELVRAVAGWAIHHQLGLAIHGKESVREYPELRGHPLLTIALTAVDDHRHELEGAENNKDKFSDPIIARQALLNIFRTNPGALPEIIAWQAIHAIEGLNYNEVHPILKPRKEYRKIGRRELVMQFDALMWVSHYVARGFKKIESLQKVADAFGIRVATLRSWQRRVPEQLGKLQVVEGLEWASVYKDDYEDLYDEKLISAGKSYRKFLKQKK